MPSNRMEHDSVDVALEGFTPSGYDHEEQSTASRLTPNKSDLTRWDANHVFLLLLLSSLFLQDTKKTEKQKLWDEEHPGSDTNCWEWGRPPVRKRSYNNLFCRKSLRMGDVKQRNTQREREAQRV